MEAGIVGCNVHLQHMVPKKPTGWCFALYYREFNENSEFHACPIAKIWKILARIGEHRPRYFGVLDRASGHHQVQVAPPCRRYLNMFITTMGIFQFK